jgi:hypothetical protein
MNKQPSRYHSFTSRYDGISNQLVSKVKIASAIEPDGNDNFEFSDEFKFDALWDTGAMCSLITPHVAKRLGLISLGKQLMRTPSGETQTEVYYINVLLPNNCSIHRVKALEGIPAGFDMLIGMDIIGLGDFAVSNYAGKTMFSFRIPSACEIDFTNRSHIAPRAVKKTQGRNELCACGSGKKYKNCCGSGS